MKSVEIRSRFLDYFQRMGHERLQSGPLVPVGDPTLLFTNAGMVQFKKVFLGEERTSFRRAVTAQKCVRAGGKHNDLEQVGITTRHHTFFEMLGNFSFGDYFKEDAVRFAWEFLTSELGLAPDRLFATVHVTDDEAYQLWQDIAGLDAGRIFRLGDRENFWQMADTGPCGPCSELHYDLRPTDERTAPSTEEFETLGESGRIMELWNLVFMQYDRDAGGTLNPLPAPSIDTGAGLERLAAVLQDVDSNYHTDLFVPLLERAAGVVGRPYTPESKEGVSYRVLADHARAVAFLLADGVFPSNEGRGYVLRRILRRGVRHAWLLGVRAPALVDVVEEVIDLMEGTYPELRARETHILQTTRREEERFLSTIEGGMDRFDEVAPLVEGDPGRRKVDGDEAFKLYDTYGFPLDLTQVMAAERGYEVDEEGFHRALEDQRARSRADRTQAEYASDHPGLLDEWTLTAPEPEQAWVGWDRTVVETSVIGVFRSESRTGVILSQNPFYSEAGGQVSDVGVVEGDQWSLVVDEVRKVEGLTAVFGTLTGELSLPSSGPVTARAQVDRQFRLNVERNHTATHLLHAALRKVLGEHVTQRGSLVTPERLRFDFSHPEPMSGEELSAVEAEVNEVIWADHPVRWEITSREEATSRGAMALFGERYDDQVRVVEIPNVSLELCGGNHLRNTGTAGPFTITREGGVASGVRRIEAVTGSVAYERLRRAEAELEGVSQALKSPRESISRRIDELLRERSELTLLLDEVRRGGDAAEEVVHRAEVPISNGETATYRGSRMKVHRVDEARTFGDAFRNRESRAVVALLAESSGGKGALFVFVTDDLVSRGVHAGTLVRGIAEAAGGRGGGRPHMAQGGIEEPDRADEALRSGEALLRNALQKETG